MPQDPLVLQLHGSTTVPWGTTYEGCRRRLPTFPDPLPLGLGLCFPNRCRCRCASQGELQDTGTVDYLPQREPPPAGASPAQLRSIREDGALERRFTWGVQTSRILIYLASNSLAIHWAMIPWGGSRTEDTRRMRVRWRAVWSGISANKSELILSLQRRSHYA
jgi:hypothetical protein